MDMEVVLGVAIALVVAAVHVLKNAIQWSDAQRDRWAPIASLTFGLGGMVAYALLGGDIPLGEALLYGLYAGFGASGLFAGPKSVVRSISST